MRSTREKISRSKTATLWPSFRPFPADDSCGGSPTVREGLMTMPSLTVGLPPHAAINGMDIFEITREPIDKLGLEKRLLTGGAGAVVTFDGVVRDNTKGRRVVSLQYEAYEPMAVKEMRRVGAEIRERWPDVERVGIIHRFGPLKISESSVVIVVTSPHRRVAFEACRYAIDRLKQTVPIWKKEIFEDGEEWVEEQAPEAGQ